MESKIYEKLNEIKDLDDRALLKKIMNSVFGSLEQYTEDRFNDLEKRVFSEIEYSKEKYNIYSTIVKREKIDVTDDFLYPILSEDIEEKIYETNEILKSIKENKPENIFKVFLKCDYLKFKEFLMNSQNIKGIIETDKKIHEAYFKVVENKKYTDKVSRLYKIFINNNVAWTTINNPYIHKIADVVLIGCKDYIEDEENIIKIDVDFGEYSEYVEYDMVPLWNIKELKLKCSGFPSPCIDKVNYEHTISIVKEGKNNGYLVDCDKIDINYIMFKKESIIVSSDISEPVFWNVLELISHKNKKINVAAYELMSNEVNPNFSNKLFFEKKYMIKTKTELARVINSFKTSKYLNFKDMVLEDNYDKRYKETYDVNDFIIDEIRDENIKRSLVLYFEPINKDNYLNKDILSFLVSQVQLLYPEYKCEGRLV